VLIQIQQLRKESAKYLLLRIPFPINNIVGVGGIEGNPQKNKTGIAIVTLLCAVQPAERAVNA
jgi:hypothetical protein